MKLRFFVTLISLIILVFIIVHQTLRIDNQKNNIDHLEILSNYIKRDIEESRTIYYLSNNNSGELYFKTQFAFVPNVVINKKYSEIPSDSLMIIVTDINIDKSNSYLNSFITDADILSSISDSLYNIKLTIKK